MEKLDKFNINVSFGNVDFFTEPDLEFNHTIYDIMDNRVTYFRYKFDCIGDTPAEITKFDAIYKSTRDKEYMDL